MQKILIALVLFIAVGGDAQQHPGTGRFPVKGELVTVTDWGSRSLYILSDKYFSATRDSIVSQIGEAEFEEMKNKCSVSGWPEGFYKANLNEEEDKAFDVELNKLKMYMIAAYTHIYNGNTFDRYVILRVPFEENVNWSPPMKWDVNVYFLLKEKDVKLIR